MAPGVPFHSQYKLDFMPLMLRDYNDSKEGDLFTT